jgi:hypothetical protein
MGKERLAAPFLHAECGLASCSESLCLYLPLQPWEVLHLLFLPSAWVHASPETLGLVLHRRLLPRCFLAWQRPSLELKGGMRFVSIRLTIKVVVCIVLKPILSDSCLPCNLSMAFDGTLHVKLFQSRIRSSGNVLREVLAFTSSTFLPFNLGFLSRTKLLPSLRPA